MATTAHSTSASEIDRRFVLAGLAAVSLSAPALSTAEALEQEHPDAPLLLLDEQLKRASTKTQLAALHANDVETKEADDAYDAAFEAEHSIISKIECVPAHTLHGLRIKAKAIAWCHSGEPIELCDDKTQDIRLAHQIIQALLTN